VLHLPERIKVLINIIRVLNISNKKESILVITKKRKAKCKIPKLSQSIRVSLIMIYKLIKNSSVLFHNN